MNDSSPTSNPSELALDILQQDVAELFGKWALHKGLFRKRETLEQMHEVSSLGFAFLQDSLTHEIIRLICALTDPAESRSGGKSRTNLSLLGIIEILPSNTDISEARVAAVSARQSAAAIQRHRNRRLMHFDHETKLYMSECFVGNGREATPASLPPLSWESVDACVVNIGEAATRIGTAMARAQMVYEWTSIGTAASALVWSLRDTVRFRWLRTLAKGSDIKSDTLRKLVENRSDRWDDEILNPNPKDQLSE